MSVVDLVLKYLLAIDGCSRDLDNALFAQRLGINCSLFFFYVETISENIR